MGEEDAVTAAMVALVLGGGGSCSFLSKRCR